MWLKAMVLAFLLNGLSPFGLRILAGRGLAEQYTSVYLFYWYLAGLVFAVLWVVVRGERIRSASVLIGVAMAASSVGGQVFMARALSEGVAGNVVFPLAMGCSICIVTAGGMLLFGEKVGPYGKAGVALGLLAAALLSVGG
ncbi:MAG: hypothetical protein ACE15E_11175 [Acidobacteriota bacterium]